MISVRFSRVTLNINLFSVESIIVLMLWMLIVVEQSEEVERNNMVLRRRNHSTQKSPVSLQKNDFIQMSNSFNVTWLKGDDQFHTLLQIKLK